MYRSLSKYIVIPNGGHEIVSTINVGFQSLFSFHKTIELPFSYCNFHFYSFNGKFKKSKILHLKRENMLYICSAKIDRCEQGSNLRGETPLDFKSNALTTRPSQLLIKYHFSFLYPLTWKLVSFFHNCVMSYPQWYIWNEMKFSNWNSYMPDIKIFENRECSMTICNGKTDY